MKKTNLILIVTCCLLFGITLTAGAQGLYFGLGYQESSNDLTVTIPDLGDLEVNLNTPCKMYMANLGYEFNKNFSIEANYSWGDTDLAGIGVNLGSEETKHADLKEDNEILKVEGKGKFAISKNLSITGIVGYANYQTTTTGTLDLSWEPSPYSADLKQTLKGTYVGAGICYAPTDKIELGASYRWMVDSRGTLETYINGEKDSAEDIQELDNSVLEVYAATNIAENWKASVGYSKTMTDYTITGANISCDNDNLWLKCQYKF